ncbi:hypothetical protein [Enterovibrio paralichthyis]|uniref:hypothetical protein n=1 Tax=Enterovibrio paralichthyis TaxID=2853805 RepID=UPI001C4885A2|nr:hypothetical protein [Enterovibrio paralichthyis]MBV7299135.1 hypothetical protein [Enterovibrio paralichthyis]
MLDPIKSAYNGELYGIAFFAHFAANYQNSSRAEVWNTLGEVEMLTARLLKSELERLGESVPETDAIMTAKGIADAEKWLHLPWPELIDTLVDWVAPYQALYQKNTDTAPGHLPLYRLVSDHENAIYAFLLAEQVGKTDSIEVLKGFLHQYAKGIAR